MYLLTVLSGLVIYYSDNLYTLGIARFLEGIGCGAFFPAAFSMISEWKNSQRSLGEFNFLLNAGLAAGVFFSGMLAGLGIKTAIGIFTLLTGISFIFILLETKEILYSGRIKKKFTLQNSNYPVKSQKSSSLLLELGSHLKKAGKTMLKSSFGKIWGVSVLLYGTTGLLTANYPNYSAGFLTKPELGLAISASYMAAMLSSLMAGKNKNELQKHSKGRNNPCSGRHSALLKMPVLAFTLIGAGGGIAVVGLITATAKISSSGFAMGIFNTGIYAGLGLGPVFGSFFMGPLGYETVFFGSALVLFTMLLCKA